VAPYAAAGQLLAINDYEYLMPHYSAYLKTEGLREEVDKLRDENGNYFVLPGFQREIQVQQWIYRKDLFDAARLGEPKTYDELFTALLALKRKYPDSRPLTACYGGAHLFAMMGAGNGIPSGWNGNRMYDRKTDSWVFAPRTKAWREMYRFLGRCHAAGLLDPDIFTQDPNAFIKKLTDGTSFVTVTWVSSGFSTWNRKLEELGIKSGFWAPMMVPQSPAGIRALPAVDRFRKGTAVSANAVAKPYFRSLMAFLDWIYYSEEGRTLAAWGVEGVTYEVKGGRKAYLPSIRTTSNPMGTLDPLREFGLNTVFDLVEVPDFEDSKKPAEIVAFLGEVLSRKLTARPDPPLSLESAEQDSIGIFAKDLDAYVGEMVRKFITGEADIDRDWDAYVATLQKRGVSSLEGIWNEAWKRRR
jgi:putative aldouronate transport system substrate-binding protein